MTSTGVKLLPNLTALGQQQAICKLKGSDCNNKILVCPLQCPNRKPLHKNQKGCFFDCSCKCEATCKTLKPNCNGFGALCYDPRFIGGDGVMFYFHGQKGGNFAIVSDDKLQINAHFIGSRPQGRRRDYTWVQALSVMFDTHTLVLGAKRVSHWDDDVDSLLVKWDGEEISVPTTGDAEWRVDSDERQVVVERTGDANSARVTVMGLVQMDVKVVPIGEEDNRIHNYQIPADDAFAHLETQFKFFDLSDLVEGILGKTYRPGYVSPAKKGVFMPMLGGEDKYQTLSLDSPDCKACRFQRRFEAAEVLVPERVIVAVKQGNLPATAFHPELTADTRWHSYFLKKVDEVGRGRSLKMFCKILSLKPNCNGFGALCYDPRFIGGDGVMFYFHGQKGGNFAVVSDDKLQINAHFIGSRPQGRLRDYTWVQALSVMFDTHTLVLGAKRVSHWDDDIDSLFVKWDGEEISVPTTGDAEWRVDSDERQVVVERTGDANSVRMTVTGLVQMDVKVVPIGEEDNRIHNYQIPADDAFAHLETQFKFFDLSELVEGILGKTYRPGYVSPAKKGVFMPMLGGEDKYQTLSLDSPDCKACRFQRRSQAASI
ncbi:hypothetical protein RHSIM_Rhsim13G0093600 [Rhododendron simsii]|uniref:Uncharacterized protein n=1 Tax=Rhododendron simsii TaxID=118357 RepID=A0A834FYQ1_RHOSS|nr:hypothetical protein RHSIM_Rhsim13G0093600 [Rhododendron simsii]